MFGLLPKPRTLAVIVAIGFLVAAVALGAIYIFQPHATLRITVGPEGTQARRFLEGFIKVAETRYPRVRFEEVTVPDLASSAKALEDGKVDIALIRSDAPLPKNGETLLIMRHDAVAFIVPHGSSISSITHLAGKTIAIPTGPAQNDNSHALDLLLSFYNVPADSVKRQFMAIEDIGPAIEKKSVAAAVAVGPVGPGDPVNTVASIARATRNTPKLLTFDDADAIVKRFPMFESYDVPEGGFKAKPAVPDDTATMLAVNYRFAVPITMLDIVANAIGRSILTAKAQFMAASPMAAQIEAPDVSDLNPLLPIHPGFASYLNNGDQSFFDQAQVYLYIFGIPLSVGASLLTLLVSTLNARRTRKDREATQRLLRIAHDAATAEQEKLEELEKEFHKAVAECLTSSDDDAKGDQWRTSLAIQHALRRFEQRSPTNASKDTARESGLPLAPEPPTAVSPLHLS